MKTDRKIIMIPKEVRLRYSSNQVFILEEVLGMAINSGFNIKSLGIDDSEYIGLLLERGDTLIDLEVHDEDEVTFLIKREGWRATKVAAFSNVAEAKVLFDYEVKDDE